MLATIRTDPNIFLLIYLFFFKFTLYFCLFTGQLRCWGSRVCCHTAGTDHHAFRTGQTHIGQSVPSKDKLLFHLIFFLCSWRNKLYFIFAFVFKERESLNSNIVHSINQASDEWGIRCLRYEIKDIHVPPRVKESMQMQVRETKELFKA